MSPSSLSLLTTPSSIHSPPFTLNSSFLSSPYVFFVLPSPPYVSFVSSPHLCLPHAPPSYFFFVFFYFSLLRFLRLLIPTYVSSLFPLCLIHLFFSPYVSRVSFPSDVSFFSTLRHWFIIRRAALLKYSR